MSRIPFIVAAACVPAWVSAQDRRSLEAFDTSHVATTSSLKTASSDTVALTSGNRMTGTVNGLSRGRLSFSIDGAGDVNINWNNVVALASSQRLDIELASGQRLIGSIASTSGDSITVNTDGNSRTIAKRDAVRMTPIAATFIERTTGSIDAGFALLNANDEFDLTLNGEAQNRTRNYLTELSLSVLVRRLDDETAQRRNHLDLKSRRYGSNRWFAIGKLELEENRALDLDLRMLAGIAPGRTFVQTNRTVFSAYAGVDYLIADYRGVGERSSYAEALGAVEWDWFEVSGSTELSLKATGYVGLGEGGARSELTGRLRRDIFGDFYWSLNFYHTYNGEPPAGLRTTDYGFGLSIGRSF